MTDMLEHQRQFGMLCLTHHWFLRQRLAANLGKLEVGQNVAKKLLPETPLHQPETQYFDIMFLVKD